MSELFKRILGVQNPAVQSPAAVVEDDFADFAGAPDPSPASYFPDPASSLSESIAPTGGFPTSFPTSFPNLASFQSTGYGSSNLPRPFTKWYRIQERVYLSDFYTEMFILPFMILVIALHIWGSGKNRRKVRSWIVAHGPILQKEFSSVGFNALPTTTLDFGTGDTNIPKNLMKEKSSTEYISYATGRQNVAFVDIKINLAKRFNPITRFAEQAMGFLFESMPAPKERMEATNFVFDGREGTLVPQLIKTDVKEKFNSTYDGFVWAIVNKESMKVLRETRYDLSLTITRDHAKLPVWATVMTESAEITDLLLTPELVKAVEQAGDALESLIITDQPIDKPVNLNEVTPKKRISLVLSLPSGTTPEAYEPTLPIFNYFLRAPDLLVGTGRFRPEVMRRVRATREEETKKIKRVDEGEKAEERKVKAEKEKKKERDEKLKSMNSEQQRKFLDKERAQDLRKAQKSRTMR